MFIRVVIVLCLGVFSAQAYAGQKLSVGGGSGGVVGAGSFNEASGGFGSYSGDVGSTGAGSAGGPILEGACGVGNDAPEGTVKVATVCKESGKGSCVVYVKNGDQIKPRYLSC